MKKNKMIPLSLLVSLLSFIPVSFAGEGNAGDYFKQAGTQIVRGLENVVTSPVEIPCTMGSEMAAHPQAGIFTGLGKGTVFMLRRLLIGVAEIGTFIIPDVRTIPPVCHVQ